MLGRIALLVLLLTGSAAADPLALTSSGLYRGVDLGTMKQWRGIPYARAPVGALRLRPAQPLGFRPGLHDATQFGSACAQPDFAGGVYGGEDCLFVNVSVPPHTTVASLLPVVVHLHGGGNFVGEGRHDPTSFVRHGVIVVTLNYRLGVLGWMAHPALSAEQGGHSGNYALRDQLLALAWVRENIVFFGGDPWNVTLAGFSAGAFDAQALAASPRTRGLIRRVATQTSAEFAVNDFYNKQADLERLGSEGFPEFDVPSIQSELGCGGAAHVLACLRQVPLARFFTDDLIGQWFPATDGDILPANTLETLRSGPGIPMLIGGGREEDGFVIDDLPVDATEDDFVAATNQLIIDRGNRLDWNYTPELLENLGDRLRAVYPPASYASIPWAYAFVETDIDKTCPTRDVALANRQTVYKFLFTHAVELDPVLQHYGSIHGVDEDILWDEHGDFPFSPAEEQLSFNMSRYWTNFAKSGDPNGAGLPRWPKFDARHESYQQLDDTISSHRGGWHAAECEVVQPVLYGAVCGDDLCAP